MAVIGKELCVFRAVQECTLNMPVIALLLEILGGQEPQLCSGVDLYVSPTEFDRSKTQGRKLRHNKVFHLS